MIRSYGKPYGFAGRAAGVGCDNTELLDEYQIQVPKSFVNLVECSGKEGAQSLTTDGKKMAGKPKQIDGKWYAVHSPVGELMVKCVEQAAKLMLLPVHITGEYLVGLPSEGWSGTH